MDVFEFVLLNNLQNLQNGEILQNNDSIWLLSVKSNITTSMSLAFAIHSHSWHYAQSVLILELASYNVHPQLPHLVFRHSIVLPFLIMPQCLRFFFRHIFFSRSIRIWTFHFNHISFFFALFRRRFSFHRFAISTIIRGEKRRHSSVEHVWVGLSR